MIYAFEVPTGNLYDLDDQQNYLFCIAPQALKDEKYKEYYKERGKEKMLVLDNGAYEKEIINGKRLLDLALELNAKELVIPDCTANRTKTIANIIAFLDLLTKEGLTNKFKIMGVVQGSDFKETILCIKDLLQLPIDVLGFPGKIHLSKTEFENEENRVMILAEYRNMVQRGAQLKPIHLLGLRHLAFLPFYRRYDNIIRSIDTSFPIALAINNKTYKDTFDKPKELLNYKIVMDTEKLQKARENIKFIKDFTI
jgi:hypothetical protein